ncbi:kinase-like domain-containing protein [Mycena haematopus]|nr:kinase-like domain-containing protein [Mycena haematopus]
MEAQRVDFTERCIAIGRGAENHVPLVGMAVSRHHATIQWNGRTDKMSVVTITDHGSTNGTFVDGEKVEGINVHQLFDGCTVFFGTKVDVPQECDDFRFTFHHPFGRSKTESIFHHYIVGDRLGGGLHGHVYRVLERKSGQVFALKTSWKDDGPDAIPCAGQETMALMIMEHDNIVRLHEVFFHVDGETIDMVLEYIDGIELQKLISHTQLSEAHAKELSFQLCLAVAFFHEKNVSHGDLKTDNVLVTREDRPKIKVIDFGLANVSGTYNVEPIVTDHVFTAPEAHFQKTENIITNAVSQRWDDWSVGCIIFNLLSSRHPFPRLINEEPPFNPAVDKISWHALSRDTLEAQDLVRKLLVPNPNDRMTAQAALNHPWLSGYEPYQVSFASVSFKLS